MGLLNLTVVCVFVFFNSRRNLVERAMSHMVSVNSLAHQKLTLHLSNFKSEALHDEQRLLSNSALEVYCRIDGKKVELVRGSSCPKGPAVEAIPYLRFTAFGRNAFLLRTPEAVMLFNHSGINALLSSREGLGDSGEIYLVGLDKHIHSASRFIESWQEVNVNNESVRLALAGKKGATTVKDYRGIDVISAYSYFSFEGMAFVLLSEIDWEEVNRPLNRLLLDLFMIGLSLILLTFWVSVYFTRASMKTVNKMNQEIDSINTASAMGVIKIQEEERERLAYNLHDSVGQYVTALKWGLSRVQAEATDGDLKEKLMELSRLCENIIKEIRSISHNIMPSLLKDFGCFLAIKDYLNQQKQIYSIDIVYEYSEEVGELKLKRAFELNLYRMVQEFIQNAVKHSGATRIRINFNIQEGPLREGQLVLSYEDNGTGMDPLSPMPRSLNYRAHMFKGEMTRELNSTGLKFEVRFDLRDVR